MIINSLKIKNIRSYENAKINFKEGITLFEGDIGSGKSTILMAIEFALFGLGSEKGAALLKIGAKEGNVSLDFEVEGERYNVFRSLVKRKTGIHQGKGQIITPNEGILKLSSTEMKEKVLKILNFNEPPNAKAKSIIYRYAIFTPQEEMKSILQMPADGRIQTLRKALRIEDYKTAMTNALSLARHIDKKIIEYTSKASDIDRYKDNLKSAQKSVKENELFLAKLTESEETVDGEYKKLQEDINEFQETKTELRELKVQIPLLKKQIQRNENEIIHNNNQMAVLTEKIEKELEPHVMKLKKVPEPTTKTEEELDNKLKEIRRTEKYLREKRAVVETKLLDYESIEKNKVCPTCDRPIDFKEFKKEIDNKLKEQEEYSAEIQKCERVMEVLDNLLKKIRGFKDLQIKINDLSRQIIDKKAKIEELESKNSSLSKIILEDIVKLDEIEKNVQGFEEIEIKISELEEMRKIKEEERGKVKKDISSVETAIKMFNETIEKLNNEIRRKQEFKSKGEYLREYYIWIKDFFIPALENIENHVMLTINIEFNQYFQKWFNILVEDPDKNAKIDEDFTPIIEQDGYEQEIEYLSGGEKTSVALAYRLALNSIVQRISTGIKSNVLILDEPTDGFSKEQLFKLREILDELECPQIIIVSHEEELESFADNIFKIEKINGSSCITSN